MRARQSTVAMARAAASLVFRSSFVFALFAIVGV